jgi:hypothetical protein
MLTSWQKKQFSDCVTLPSATLNDPGYATRP